MIEDDGTNGCNSTPLIGCNTTGSIVGQVASPNTTYYIGVASGNGVDGTFTVTVTAQNPPSNDLCTNALDISLASLDPANVGVSGTTTCATNDANDFCALVSEDHVVYYEYTVDPAILTNRDVIINIVGDAVGGNAATNLIFGLFEDCFGTAYTNPVFSGDNCDALSGQVTYKCVEPGTVLTIAVGSPTGGEGDFTITITEDATGLAVNDACANATPLSAGMACVATVETVPNNGGCPETDNLGTTCLFSSDKTVWHTITLPAGADEIEFTALGVGVQLALFENTCVPLTLLGGDCFTGDNTFTGLTPGGTYLLAASLTGAIEGDMTFTWTPIIPIANDDCDLINNPALVNATTLNGTTGCADSDLNFCSTGTDGHDVFYTYTNNTGANTNITITINGNILTTGTATTDVSVGIYEDCLTTMFAPNECNTLGTAFTVDCVLPLQQLVFIIGSPDGSEGDFDITLTEDNSGIAANDDCSGAIPLSVGTTCETTTESVTNVNACPEATGLGVVSCDLTADAVAWYTLTMPAGATELEFSGLGANVQLSLFDNVCPNPTVITSVGGNTCITADDEFTGLTGGNTYLVAVSLASQAQGAIDFSWTPGIVVANDDCDAMNNPALTNATPVDGTTACADGDLDFCGLTTATSHGVFYTYTNSTGTNVDLDITVTANTSTTGVAMTGLEISIWEDCTGTLYQPEDCGAALNAAYNVDCISPGDQIIIYIASNDTEEGDFSISVTEDTTQPTDGNDNCVDAHSIDSDILGTCQFYTINGSTAEACPEDTDFGGCSYTQDATVWYSFTTPTTTNPLTVEIQNIIGVSGAYATIFNNDCAAPVPVGGCNTGTGPFGPFMVMSNTTYLIAVGDGAEGAHSFQIQINELPANDDPCDAEMVAGTAGDMNITVSGTTVCATQDYAEPSCGADNENSVWYEYTVPSDATGFEITLTGTGGTPSTSVAVGAYSTTACGGGTPTLLDANVGVECDTENNSLSFQCLMPGTTVFVYVSTSDINSGTFDITFDPLVPDPTCIDNDLCADADVAAFSSLVTDGGQVCIDDCNAGACPEGFSSGACDYSMWPTVFYSVTTDALAIDATMAVSLAGINTTTADPIFSVYTSCGAGAVDPVSECVESGTLTGLDIMPSTTYIIAVALEDAAGGDFQLCVTVSTTCNDDPCTPFELTPEVMPTECTTTVGSTNETFTYDDGGCPDVTASEATVYFTYIPSEGVSEATITFTNDPVDGITGNMIFTVVDYDVNTCDMEQTTILGQECGPAGGIMPITITCPTFNEPILIQIGSTTAGAGEFDIIVNETLSVIPNEICSTPDVTAFTAQAECEWMDAQANTLGACPESFDFTSDCGFDDFPVVWFQATAPAGATGLDIRVLGAAAGTPFIGVFDSNLDCDDVINSQLLGCQTGTFADLDAAGETLIDVLPGDVILFGIGTNEPLGSATIDFSIKWNVPPVNDECDMAITLSDNTPEDGSTACATQENPFFASTACDVVNQENTVWYEITVPAGSKGFTVQATATAMNGFTDPLNVVVFETASPACDISGNSFVDDVCINSGVIDETFECIGEGTYIIRISTSAANEGDFQLIVDILDIEQPNDECSSPAPIDPILECVWMDETATTTGACPESFDFMPGCGLDDFPVVWYEATAPAGATSMDLRVTAAGSGTPFIAAFEGNPISCDPPDMVALTNCLVDLFDDLVMAGETLVPVNPGDVILIAVGTDDPAGTTIDFGIKFIVAPPNDECVDAEVLSNGLSVMGTTTCATAENPLQVSTACSVDNQENTVWYEFTVPEGVNGFDVTVTATATDGFMGDLNIVVFESTAVGCVADNSTFVDDVCTTSGMLVEDFECIGPGTYVIRISTSELNEGDFDIIINEYTSPVVNDLCSNPTLIDVNVECEWIGAEANTVDACPEQFDFASDCGFDDFPVVWYEINVTNDDATEIQINLISSITGDAFYSVFNGNQIDCDDLTGESISGFCENTLGQNTVTIDIEANMPQTYLIGIGADAPEGSASIQFEVKVVVPPSNDDPCTPEVITTVGDINTTVPGTTICATLDFADTNCGATQYENTVWYEYAIPTGTTGFIATLTSTGTGQDFALGAYEFLTGCTNVPTALDPEVTPECESEDGDELKYTCLDEGTVVYIMVSTADAEAGDFELTIDPITPDPLCIDNDLCDMADDASTIATPITDGGQVCVSDCNFEACPWDFNAGACMFTEFPTVFYTVTTDANAEDATMTTILSSADGNPFFSIIELDCNNPAAVTAESFCVEGDGAAANLANMEVDANTTYLIVVALDEIDAEGGDFELCVNVTTSCNDDPCSPYPLVDGDGVNTIALDCDNNIGSTDEPFDYVSGDCDDPLLFASTVYFSYTVPDNISSFTLFYTNDPVNGILNSVGINIMVYDAANCAFQQVEVVDQQCIQPGNVEPMEVDCPTSGDTYLIQITSAAGDEGEFDILITETIQDDPCAANDDCDFAMELDVSETCVWLEFPDCNIQACPEEFVDPGMECAFDASAVVWYTFTTPPNAASAGIELVPGTVTDPTWGLFTDNGCAVPPTAVTADVICVTTGGGGTAIEEDIPIEENTTYYIAVGSETNIEGDFTLNIKIDVPPENDDPCINDDNPPFDLSGGGSHNGTTCCARGPKDANPDGSAADFENVDCSAATEDAAVWYIFTPNEADDGYNIILEPGDIEGPTSLEVYTGTPDGGCTGGLTLIASSCNSNSADIKLGNCFTPGEVLFVKVTSDDADENCGTFILTINPASCGPMADDCIDTAMETPIMPITNPEFTLDYFCVPGCLDYACPEDDAMGGCGDFVQAPTVWFQVTTDDIAAQMFTTVEANGNWTPVWSIWSGTSCDDLEIVNFGGAPPCSNGDNTPELHQVGVFDDVPNYWIAITATDIPPEGIDDGSFELCVATTINAIICLGEEIGDCDDPTLVMEIIDREIDDQPLEGPFCQGEEVTVNISFFYDASESGADWLIGIVPIFGNGWDLENFDYAANAPVGNGTTAEWYETDGDCAPIIQEPNPILCTFVNADGQLTLCNQLCDPCTDCPQQGMQEGDPLPSGYFWVSNGGNAGCDNDCSPGEGWGIGSVQSQIDWTFTLTVKEFDNFDDCFENKDLSISFQTFSDGVAGCWEDPVGECILDRAMFSPPWEIECEAPPAVEGPDDELCHDGVTDIFVQTVDGSTTTVIVEVEDNPFVTGENNYTFNGGTGTIMDDLLNLTNDIQIVIYNVYSEDLTLPCPGPVNQIEVTIYPELVAEFDPTFVCEGDCADITPNVFGGIGVPYTYNWSTGETTPSINVCPVVPTTYFVTVEDALGCMDVAEVQVDVKPPVEVSLPESIEVCKDDNFDPFNPDYIVCLDFLSGSSPFAVTWDAPIGLVGTSGGFAGECFIINELASSEFGGPLGNGVYTLTANVIDFFGCMGTTEMTVSITGELILVVDYADLQCGETEVDITATGFDAAGNEVTNFFLYGGCPDDGLGDFLEESFSNSGVVTFPTQDLLAYTCYTIVAQTDAGCQTTQDITIPLTEGIPIVITGTPEVCIGEEATITITNASDYDTFVWTPDIGNTSSVSFTPDSTFTYFVEATDATGCVAQEVFTVTVNDLPSISIAGTTTFCEGGTASVTASGGVMYDWTSTIAGFPISGPTISVGEPGEVTLVMTDDNGCSSDTTFTFTQEDVITISLGDVNICDGMGDTVFISNDFVNIEWFDATPTLVSDTNFYVITGAGSFTVQALDGTTGCDASGSFEVMDFMTPMISVSDTVEVCRIDSGIDSLCVNFNAQVSGSSGSWTQIDPIPNFTVDLSDLSNVCFENAQTGCYAFMFSTNSAEDPCEDVMDTMIVCVNACPCPSPATQPIDTLCNIGTTNLEFAEVTTDPGTWSVESGPATQDLTGILTGTIFNASGILAGDYVVRFTLDNPGSPPECELFSEQTITVFEAPVINTVNGVMCNIDNGSDPTVLDLYTLLTNADATDGGTWMQTDGPMVTITGGSTIMSSDLSTFPVTLEFTYTSGVEAGSPCPPDEVTVEVLIRDCNCPFVDVLPDTLCNNGALINLNDLLVNPDGLAGTWSTTGTLVGTNMFDPSGLPSGLYTITYTLATSPGPNCDLEYSDDILIRRQSVAVPRMDEPPCSVDTGNGPTTSNLYDWLEAGYSSGTWVQTGGTPNLPFTDNGLDMAMVDFVNQPIGSMFTFTFTTNDAEDPCTNIAVEVIIEVVDCNCPPIVLDPAPDICNDMGMIDLCELAEGSDPGTFTVTSIGGTDFSDRIDGCIFDGSGLNPGEFVLTFTLDQLVTGICDQFLQVNFNVIQYLSADPIEADEVCNDPDGNGITTLDFTALVTNASIGTWEDTDGTGVAIGTLTELQSVSFIGVPAGTYTFTYTIDNAEPCEDVVLTIIISVTDDCNCPPIDPLNPDEICSTDGPVDLTQYDDPNNAGLWSSAELTIENGVSLIIDGVDAGTYTLTYTILDPLPDCPVSADVTIMIGTPGNSGVASEAVRFCEGVVEIVDLASLLTDADNGGTWTETSSTASGTFDAGAATVSTNGVAAGTYTFAYTISNNEPCPEVSSEVTVIIDPNPVADAGSEKFIDCENTTADIGGDNTSTGDELTYTWVNTSTGEDVGTTASINVSNAGIYELTVINTETGCMDVSTVEVIKSDDLPTMTVTPMNITCFGDDNGGVTLSDQTGGDGDYSYSLNNGAFVSDPNSFGNLPADDYTIVIADGNGCMQSYSFTITEPAPVVVDAGPDIIFGDIGETFELSIEPFDTSTVTSIVWSLSESGDTICSGFDCTTIFVSPTELTTNYYVEVMNENGCVAFDEVQIQLEVITDVIFPNIITPNGDNSNDVFYIKSKDVETVISMKVFDRWGEKLFDAENFPPRDPQFGWDGKFNGRNVVSGVYVFIAEVKYFNKNETETFKGDVTVTDSE
ncbi:MAG: gliding motility-associated C-terminal domain-containing protein [Saprospiraceae bacterium]|nr:gliding motility-associated C-terminal domain-containing protein [Saprospiraceae bacterium]